MALHHPTFTPRILPTFSKSQPLFSCALWNVCSLFCLLPFSPTPSTYFLLLKPSYRNLNLPLQLPSPMVASNGLYHSDPVNEREVELESFFTKHFSGPSFTSLSSFEAHWFCILSLGFLKIAGPVSSFLEDLSAWLPFFPSFKIPTIILGDFSIPVNVTTPSTHQLHSPTSSFDLMLKTCCFTHSDGNTIDLVFSHLCTPCNLFNTTYPFSDDNLMSLIFPGHTCMAHYTQNKAPVTTTLAHK